MKHLFIFLIIALFNLPLQAQVSKSIEKANQYADAGNYEEAIKVMDKEIKKTKYCARCYNNKFGYQLMNKQYKEAIVTISDGIELMPDSAELYDARGNLLLALRMYPQAIQDFTMGYTKAKTNTSKAHFLANRGGTKSKIMDHEGAYKDLKKAIELDSTNLDAYNNLSVACGDLGKTEEGLTYLEKIIQLNPEYVAGYINLGFTYQEMGEHKKAITYFNKAIDLDPKEAYAYSNRAFSRYSLGDYDGALKDINSSLKYFPDNSYAFKIRALIYLAKNEKDLACQDLNQAKDYGYEENYGKEVNELLTKHCE